MPVLSIRDLKKSYSAPDGSTLPILDVPHLEVAEGESVALVGTSGSGKTTLLQVIAGIVGADSGEVRLAGVDMLALREAERDAHRARHLGYVFQTFQLLDGFTALENVVLGSLFGTGPDPRRARALLERLGLGDRCDHPPSRLSVGQQQRVALARALVGSPDLVLADEPTGNLDPRRAASAVDLLQEVCGESGAALLLVSHDRTVVARCSRVVELAEVNRALATGDRS